MILCIPVYAVYTSERTKCTSNYIRAPPCGQNIYHNSPLIQGWLPSSHKLFLKRWDTYNPHGEVSSPPNSFANQDCMISATYEEKDFWSLPETSPKAFKEKNSNILVKIWQLPDSRWESNYEAFPIFHFLKSSTISSAQRINQIIISWSYRGLYS